MCVTAQVDVVHQDSPAWKEEKRERKKKKVCALAATVAKNTLPTSSARLPFSRWSMWFFLEFSMCCFFHLISYQQSFTLCQLVQIVSFYSPVDIIEAFKMIHFLLKIHSGNDYLRVAEAHTNTSWKQWLYLCFNLCSSISLSLHYLKSKHELSG